MLERKDVKVGDLLVGNIKNSLRIHPILDTLYLVVDIGGYGKNGIYLRQVGSNRKVHCETRWFRKTDNFCP